MPKRLLALLVFIPMFLIANYVRNNHQPSANSPETRTTDNRQDDRSSGAARDDHRSGSNREAEPSGSRSDTRRSHGRESGGASDRPGTFDFYLLNLSWSPEFCATHPGKPECAARPGFVLHGLWPQNNDGTYPEHCFDAAGPADPSAFRDLFPDAGLLRHEWSTHGTCSGLAPEAYFAQARSAFHAIAIPNTLSSLNHQTSSTPDEILTQFAHANPAIPRESLALSCGNNYLTAVEVCLDRSLHATACSNIRSCRANSIRIIPPGGVNQ